MFLLPFFTVPQCFVRPWNVDYSLRIGGVGHIPDRKVRNMRHADVRAVSDRFTPF